jgi:hypothetical protein
VNPLELQVLVLVSRLPETNDGTVLRVDTVRPGPLLRQLPARSGRPLKAAWSANTVNAAPRRALA